MTDDAPGPDVPGPGVPVLLAGYPVRLGLLEREHIAEVLRELQLLSLDDSDAPPRVPVQLVELVRLLAGAYGDDVDDTERQLQRAVRAGEATVDLVCAPGPGSQDVLETWNGVLAELDEHARHDNLLSLATPADVLALRRWVLAEFHGQAAGAAPTRWTGPV